MNNKKMLLLSSLLLSNALNCAVGCYDRSYHRQKDLFYEHIDPTLGSDLMVYRDDKELPEDTKSWHPVSCTCPCNKYFAWYHSKKIDAAGLCPVCMHRGPIGRQAPAAHELSAEDIARDFPLLSHKR